jgi:dTDP-4-amino-4,6-dideoxygalactose transaminase
MTAEIVIARVSLTKPWLGAEEAKALAEVVASGLIGQGPKVKEFEAGFSATQEVRHAIATSSCTAALHLALVAAGIGPGDDVVVPSLSHIATANTVTYVGARPVFCDVDPATGTATAETIHAALTLDTRAVIVVDQCGMPVDLDPIRELCDPHEITVIEDAASAVGSLYKGRPVGTSADLTVWSFHSDKVITTGEGGMLTTHRADWAARARRLREHSRGPFRPDGQESVEPLRNVSLEIGFNYCLTDLQAAVGTVQLRRLAQVVSRRREIAGMYVAGLAGLKGLRLVVDPPYGNTNFQSFWVEVLPGFAASREALLSRLEDAGISATSGTMAAHRQPAYRWRDTGHARLQHTDRLSDSTLVLPVFHELDTVTIYRIINTILTAGGGSVR